MILQVVSGDRQYCLRPEDSPVTLGREASSPLYFSEPRVSRRHGRLLWLGDAWFYQDRSRHGTWLLCRDRARQRICGKSVPLPPSCALVLADESGPRLLCRWQAPEAAWPPGRLYREAWGRQQAGRWGEAIPLWLQLAEWQPLEVAAMGHLAACLEEEERRAEALVWAVRYALCRRTDPRAWLLLARLQLAMGDEAAAQSYARQARTSGASASAVDALWQHRSEGSTGARAGDRAASSGAAPAWLHSEHFRTCCYGESTAVVLPELLTALEQALRLAKGILPAPPAPIVLAVVDEGGTAVGWEGETPGAAVGGAEVFLPPSRARACRDTPHMLRLAAHVVVEQLLTAVTDTFPWWLCEGLAQWLVERHGVPSWWASPAAVPDLEQFETAPADGDRDLGYALSYAAVQALMAALGEDGFRRWLERLLGGARPNLALAHEDVDYPRLSAEALARWRAAHAATGD